MTLHLNANHAKAIKKGNTIIHGNKKSTIAVQDACESLISYELQT